MRKVKHNAKPERNRVIFCAFKGGMPYAELAAFFEITRERVQYIVVRERARLQALEIEKEANGK